MSKKQYSIALTGLIKENNQWVNAKTHQADAVTQFKGMFPEEHGNCPFYIDHRIEGSPVLVTPKGKYPMSFNKAGYFQPDVPVPGDIKIHVTLKKTVGKLIYWAEAK